MPIAFPSVPAEVAQSFHKLSVSTGVDSKSSAESATTTAGTTSMSVSPTRSVLRPGQSGKIPHGVYVIAGKAMTETEFPHSVRLVAWRINLAADGKAAEISLGKDGKNAAITSRSKGGLSTHMEREVARAVAESQNEVVELEPRLLRVPDLWLTALWLHDPQGGMGDVFVPLPPTNRHLEPGRRYTLPELVKALVVEVQQAKQR